ncbi:MAG: TIGR04282 family arsenosugar biosynthesis glycosyltransferase [Hyphomicrobiaceae bacterium]|nr:TIGR04282 family arsenosugar biosynthesis glycosyltransferase [Hyphomicrobiaceae bacterium]
MLKAPAMGRVKTRLARDIGVVRATWFYRHATRMLLQRLSRDPRWSTLIAVAPDGAVAGRSWPESIARRPQGNGDLGARMQRLFDGSPPGPVVIIGTDCIDVTAADIAAAFRALGSSRCVLGPARDGGYWLIGQSRMPRPLAVFAGVRWSGPDTLTDTMANLNGYSTSLLQQLEDVDTADEWRRSAAAGVRCVGSRTFGNANWS